MPGWRKITVGGRVYRWVLYEDRVVVLPPASGRRRVEIELIGWSSPSYAKNRGEQDPPLVTPGFVRGLIAACIRFGWNPDDRGAPLRLRRTAHTGQLRSPTDAHAESESASDRSWQIVDIDGTTYRWRRSADGVEVLGSGVGCRVLGIELAPSEEVTPERVMGTLRTARETIGWDLADPSEDLDLRVLG